MPSKSSIATNLLAPAPAKTIQFVGKAPARIFDSVKDLMKDIFGMDSGSIWEDKIKWDTSSNPVSFYGLWRGKMGKDAYSKVWIEIEAAGTQSKEDGTGELSVKIKGKLETSFKHSTILHRGMFRIFKITFYKKQREQYMIDAVRKLNDFEDAIREQFELMRREE